MEGTDHLRAERGEKWGVSVLPPHFGALVHRGQSRLHRRTVVMAVHPKGYGKHWCFTLNNPQSVLDCASWNDALYVVYQEEVAPDTGTVHFQGYAQFSARKRLSQVRKYVPGAHWEIARGTPEQNRTYCTKAESRRPGTAPVEYGTIESSGQGKRSDLSDALSYIEQHVAAGTLDEWSFAKAYPQVWCRYPALIYRAASFASGAGSGSSFGTSPNQPPLAVRSPPQETVFGSDIGGSGCIDAGVGLPNAGDAGPARRTRIGQRVSVVLYLGKPGIGKTSLIADQYQYAYWKSPGKWWDGYLGQRTVMFDDFDGSWFTCSELLRILQAFPYRVEVKGSTFEIPATDFVLTSNIHPDLWYQQHFQVNPDHKLALRRRITTVVVFDRDVLGQVTATSMTGEDFFNPAYVWSGAGWKIPDNLVVPAPVAPVHERPPLVTGDVYDLVSVQPGFSVLE